MKLPIPSHYRAIFLLIPLTVLAAKVSRAQSIANATSTPYAITARDANSAIWERTSYETNTMGQIIPHVHRYTELATGLNYRDAATSQWTPSKEEIDILPDGSAAATNGQHQAYFPNDIYNGVIKLVTPDGKVLQSQPAGLSYDDGSHTALIAVLTNSVGELVGSNQIVYPNAFVGINADLRYTYRKSGFEQDVILHERPPDPAALGLNPAMTRLQVLTEFFNPPQPKMTIATMSTRAGTMTDSTLNFGAMLMGRGKAFLFGTNSPPVQVNKQWVQMDGRQFLVEAVPMTAMTNELESLPSPAATTTQINPNASSRLAGGPLILPPPHWAQATPGRQPMPLAKAMPPTKGLVLDYNTINSSLSNYTFQANATYYISGAVELRGTDTFESGAVLKYASGAEVADAGYPCQFNWQASMDEPVVFTAKDDNSVGETISGSTGSPSGYYAEYALNLYEMTNPIANFRIAYAQEAILAAYSWNETNDFSDGQIIDCRNGIDCESETVNLQNLLFANVQTNITTIYSGTVMAQNVSFSGSASLIDDIINGAMSLENCILANVTTLTNLNYPGYPATLSGLNNGFYDSPNFGSGMVTSWVNPFATGPQGDYYLAPGSSFINAGNETAAAADLSAATTQTNQTPDTGTVDLGYHYPVGNTSAGTDFWFAFFNLPTGDLDYGFANLSLYISSPVNITGTVTFPANGPTLTISGCSDTNINGIYEQTNMSETEQDYAEYYVGNLDSTMYVKGSLQMVYSTGSDYYAYIVTNDDINSGSFTILYSSPSISLNESDWSGLLTMSYPQVPFSQPFSVAAGSITNISIPLSAMMSDYDTNEAYGIHVIASQPVSVYGLDYCPDASTAFTAYPTSLLGTNYCVMARAGFFSQFAILATEDNTTVIITPSATADLAGFSTLSTNIVLQQGDVYQANSSDDTDDVTGTQISADKPVAIFAGAFTSEVPDENTPAANPLLQEQLPVEQWGTNVLTLGFAFRQNGDSYRILAASNDTEITITGTVVTVINSNTLPYAVTTNSEIVTTNLDAGQFYDLVLEGPAQFQSTKPIQVAQFANGSYFDYVIGPNGSPDGDPCEIFLPPINQCLTTYIIATPSQSDIDTNYIADYGSDAPLFTANYLNLVVPQAATNTTLVDGSLVTITNFVPILNTGYYGAQISVTNGTHIVSSSQPIEVQVYGFSTYDAYGYFGGVVNFP